MKRLQLFNEIVYIHPLTYLYSKYPTLQCACTSARSTAHTQERRFFLCTTLYEISPTGCGGAASRLPCDSLAQVGEWC